MDVQKTIKWGLVFASVVTVGDLGLYFFRFAPGQWLTLSANTEEWARFGEFLGGTLGPFFALLAFVGVVFTISEQRRQAHVDEVQRLLASVADGIDRLLQQPLSDFHLPVNVINELGPQGHTSSVTSLLHRLVAGAQMAESPSAAAANKALCKAAAPCIARQCGALSLDFSLLVALLGEYAALDGSTTVQKFYSARYVQIVRSVYLLGFVSNDGVKALFAVKDHVPDNLVIRD
jgi:hypothetical protein